MAIQIQLRRGTEAEWTAADPTLAEGELGLSTDVGKFKVGDGVTAWSALTYFEGDPGADGDPGTPGADGKTVLSGAGAPGAGTGADGDFYIDTTAWDIYGPKAGGAWGSGTSIVGPAGTTSVAALTTAETDTDLRLAPDGLGGVAWSTGGAGSPLTVKEEDGAPSVANVTEIKVTNGTLTDNGAGSVSITTGGGAGSVDPTDVSLAVAMEVFA